MYTVFFISLVGSCKCFGCYLHPSSGAQLQRIAIGFVSVENRGFSIKWCGANDERNKEYSVHLVGPELNIYIYIYITKMY
jgi:hypothetical protein